MAKDFILPDIGEGIVECEVVEWLVAVGDEVKEDQPICDVMTDKALVQIPAVHNGVITELYYAKGDIAKVHAPLFAMDVEGEAPTANVSATAAKEPTPVQAAATGSALEDFILPDIGEGIVECEIVEWLVAEGDDIEEDQPVCDVMTDKALVQIPAKYDGKVMKLYYQKGDIAKVHSPLFQMEIAGSGVSASAAATADNATEVQSAAPANADKPSCEPVAQGKALASPAVRRRARELDIDISTVPGSGKNGRVFKEDIEKFVAHKGATTSAPPAIGNTSVAPSAPVSGGTRVEPIKGMKAAMAKQMVASVSTIPHFTYSDEIDLTDLIALRGSMKEQYKQQGVKLTMMPFFIKALSLAIIVVPVLI